MNELTDEQIDCIAATHNLPRSLRNFARAIIAADRAQREQAQGVPNADDILMVVCETDPADFNDKRNICISPEDLGDILRGALHEDA